MPFRGVPAQYTDDDLGFDRADLIAVSKISSKVGRAARMAEITIRSQGREPYEDPEYLVIDEIRSRKEMLESEQARLATMFRRFDNLYYADAVTDPGGADHWPLSAEQKLTTKTHVSVNTPPAYVDIPASLQAVPPVENYVPTENTDEARDQASRSERLYFQWKDDEDFELKMHVACITKELYGISYVKVYWDSIEKRPTASVIQRPENLFVGWGASDFSRMDWAIYCYGLSPQAIAEDFGLGVDMVKGERGVVFPYVHRAGTHSDPIGSVKYSARDYDTRPATAYEQEQVEVYDYWYKKPGKKGKKPEVWNAIYAGNMVVKNELHAEYDDIPYVPVPNGVIPGSPYGRPALFDLEQLFREKDERVTNAAQMLQSIVGGQMWQLVGAEAPDEVPVNAIPKPNGVAAPGPGNELRALQPFVPQFFIEDYLKRIDQELEDASGMNPIVLGRAPAQVLGSSKAVNALLAQYAARIRIKREVLYRARRRIWAIAAKVWESKDSGVKKILDGNYRIAQIAPELTPHDDLENTQKAINLVQNGIWSVRRAMDATGVEDPEEEVDLVREERTDPAMNPSFVLQQATVLGTLKELGVTPGADAIAQTENATRQTRQPAGGSSSLNQPENRANPAADQLPENARAGNGAGSAQLQSLVNGEGVQSRVLTTTPLGEG